RRSLSSTLFPYTTLFRSVFQLAPLVALVRYLVAMVAVPLGPGLVGEGLDLGLFFVLAVLSVGVLGQLMAGWASASKFSLLGGLRDRKSTRLNSSHQIISY